MTSTNGKITHHRPPYCSSFYYESLVAHCQLNQYTLKVAEIGWDPRVGECVSKHSFGFYFFRPRIQNHGAP